MAARTNFICACAKRIAVAFRPPYSLKPEQGDNVTSLDTEFMQTVRKLTAHRSPRDVFTVLCRIVADRIDPALAGRTEFHENAKKLTGDYSHTEKGMFEALIRLLPQVLQENPRDFLGECVMSLELGNTALGQYFTPGSLASLKFELLKQDYASEIRKHGFIILQEPAVGSGGLIIKMANGLADAGFNPSASLFVSCADNDALAADMAFIQLSLLGIAAEVSTGDTLRMEFRKTRYTLAYWLNNFKERLKVRRMFEVMADTGR
ncbi:N-6 DNA methylase [Citrobacter freundii]|uniref:N-6 DNA methylase n=1 Tax=Citrobacter freundii TaxID=546 RepID=UPI0028C17707|nr:N-6 DNA methylase [Citrobacter freundii]MDT7068185.1 N-6 DNA methylase [Citrobacter freundii]MDT7083229.1 N-6 DNA methylase [Citrobacter freundii]MDT7342693.1 N-6 DNA methylase [Citrobacter freundii]MDT7398460.1 N-6 DNA methylase [Citrobacter freundii]MDT7444129.1 N-6 DNA methylase [Citrobacter freundii]